MGVVASPDYADYEKALVCGVSEQPCTKPVVAVAVNPSRCKGVSQGTCVLPNHPCTPL